MVPYPRNLVKVLLRLLAAAGGAECQGITWRLMGTSDKGIYNVRKVPYCCRGEKTLTCISSNHPCISVLDHPPLRRKVCALKAELCHQSLLVTVACCFSAPLGSPDQVMHAPEGRHSKTVTPRD